MCMCMCMYVVLCCVVSSAALPPSSTFSDELKHCPQDRGVHNMHRAKHRYSKGTPLLSLLDQSWTEIYVAFRVWCVFGQNESLSLRCRSLAFRALEQSQNFIISEYIYGTAHASGGNTIQQRRTPGPTFVGTSSKC